MALRDEGQITADRLAVTAQVLGDRADRPAGLYPKVVSLSKGVKAVILSAPYLSSPLWDKDQRDHIAKMPSEVIKAIEEGEKMVIMVMNIKRPPWSIIKSTSVI